MKLKDYLDKFGIPNRSLAKRTGMCDATVNRILQGKNMRLDLAWNIVKFTNNEVTFDDLYSALKLKKKNEEPSDQPQKKKAKKAKA